MKGDADEPSVPAPALMEMISEALNDGMQMSPRRRSRRQVTGAGHPRLLPECAIRGLHSRASSGGRVWARSASPVRGVETRASEGARSGRPVCGRRVPDLCVRRSQGPLQD
ncbi:hypothetical protein NDU88_000290 [Pleurodeles waltl]|uniref:Uncharacterized protein n=1 Tax=Pleurodeles waltl TaxID=8319 RepID=A0AAV7MIF3_PLEWA|nr:hypothetical protein NDU88_000290 [Pleurodeles waltl]